MKYKYYIYTLLSILLLIFMVGAIFLAQYANKYEVLANHPEFSELKSKIQSQNDMALLKKTALHLHKGTIDNAKDNSASLANLSELFIAISVIIAIIIFMFYKYTISNKVLNSDTAKSAAPVS